MVIKATDPIKERSPVAKIKVFRGSQSALTQALSRTLCAGLEAKGFPVSAAAWDPSAVADVGTEVYVVLDNTNQPSLSGPSTDEFEALKSLLTKCRSLLWVNFHESDSDHAAAMQGLVTGMARVIRRENEGVKFITLDVKEPLTSELNPLVDAILKVAETCFWPKSEADSSDEDEYAFSHARLEIPRIHTDSCIQPLGRPSEQTGQGREPLIPGSQPAFQAGSRDTRFAEQSPIRSRRAAIFPT